MGIETEPHPMSKRQRKWYDKGRTAGIWLVEAKYENDSVRFRNRGWELQHLQARDLNQTREIQNLNGQVALLRRDLQFANDRIEQLIHNASSIPPTPREKK